MKKETKIIVGGAVVLLLLLWWKKSKKSASVKDEGGVAGGGADSSTESGVSAGGGAVISKAVDQPTSGKPMQTIGKPMIPTPSYKPKPILNTTPSYKPKPTNPIKNAVSNIRDTFTFKVNPTTAQPLSSKAVMKSDSLSFSGDYKPKSRHFFDGNLN
jgi:hypothetical protein